MGADVPADLRPERILEGLRTRYVGRKMQVVRSTDSTNDDARRAAEGGADEGLVVVADQQRSGRGSRGNHWSSPGGTDLYFSLVLRPALPPEQVPPLTLAIGLAVSRAVSHAIPPTCPRPQVKWPNDLWIAGKKCCGILVEASSTARALGPVVVGVGLGVNRVEFPPALASQATSMREVSGQSFERAKVLSAVLNCVEEELDRFIAEGVSSLSSRLEEHLALLNEQVQCGAQRGVFRGLGPEGHLLLEVDGQLLKLSSGPLRPA